MPYPYPMDTICKGYAASTEIPVKSREEQRNHVKSREAPCSQPVDNLFTTHPQKRTEKREIPPAPPYREKRQEKTIGFKTPLHAKLQHAHARTRACRQAKAGESQPPRAADRSPPRLQMENDARHTPGKPNHPQKATSLKKPHPSNPFKNAPRIAPHNQDDKSIMPTPSKRF